MGLFGIFDIGKNALFAAQTALTVTNNNIANANTPHYTRQGVMLEVADPVTIRGGLVGRGAVITGIRREYDTFVQAQLLGQRQSYGRALALDRSLGQIEQVFNEAAGMGLAGPLAEYFSSWHEVVTNPEGVTQRSVLMQKASALVTAARRMERGSLDTIRQANEELGTIATRVNDIARTIVDLNVKIKQIEAGAGRRTANDLRDRREALLNDLAELADIAWYEDQNGEITVTMGMRNLVERERRNTLHAPVGAEGNRRLILDGIDITDRIRNGKISGLVDVRRSIEDHTLTPLRRLVASLVKETNLLHAAGFGLDGSTGNSFFNGLTITTRDEAAGADITATIVNLPAVTLDEYEVRFNAAGDTYSVYRKDTTTLVQTGAYSSGTPVTVNGIEFTVTGAVNHLDRFVLSPLTSAISNFGVSVTDPRRIAASSALAEIPGNNLNALAIAGLAESAIADLGTRTFSAYYRGLVSDVGTMRRAAADTLRFDENLLSELTKRREAVSGVSLDEEAANLIRYQRSYEAAARMIRVADELLQTLLSL